MRLLNYNFVDIMILISSLVEGGAEKATVNLVRNFIDQGFKVDLILFWREGVYFDFLPKAVRVISLSMNSSNIVHHSRLYRVFRFIFHRELKSVRLDFLMKLDKLRKRIRSYFGQKSQGLERWNPYVLRLADYLRETRPKALLAVMTEANLVAIKAKQLAHVPSHLVLSERTTSSLYLQEHPRGDFMKRCIREFYPKADIVVAVSKGVAEDLVENFGLPPEKVRVIYNPVMVSEVQRMAAEEVDHPWFKPDQPPVILGVGRLVPAKDFPTLLRAFSLVRQVRPARLVILGEGKGEERPKLERIAYQLGIQNDVLMPGFVKNPYAFMAKSAVFVLSSAYEGCPNVVIEALACGCPVVSTDCRSGPREILDGGRYGRLVSVGDVEGLARAILETLENPNMPADKEARIRRAMDFSIDKIANQYLETLGLKK